MITTKPRILCVDDEPNVLKFFEAVLVPNGYEVVKSGDGEEAMKIALGTLWRFPDDPASYQNLADAFWTMGWKNEAREILNAGVEKFPEDEELWQMTTNSRLGK